MQPTGGFETLEALIFLNRGTLKIKHCLRNLNRCSVGRRQEGGKSPIGSIYS